MEGLSMATVGYSSPLRFRRNIRPGVQHPLDGAPIDVVAKLNGAMSDAFPFFVDDFQLYQGPLVEATTNGYELAGAVGVATAQIADDADHGRIQLITGATEDDNLAFRRNDAPILYSTTDLILVASRFNLSIVNDMEAFFGIAENVDDWVATLPDFGLFFEKAETATNFDFHVRSSGTSTENTADFTGVTLTNTTDVICVIRIENGHVTPWVWTLASGWVSGTTVLSSDANMPSTTEQMVVTWAAETGSAAAKRVDIDWVLAGKVA